MTPDVCKTFANYTVKKSSFSIDHLKHCFLSIKKQPQGDSNPCFRRERAKSKRFDVININGKAIKSGDNHNVKIPTSLKSVCKVFANQISNNRRSGSSRSAVFFIGR